MTDGRIWLKPSGLACFCGDLPEAEQKLVYATQGVPVPDLFDQKVEGTAWKTKPSWSIVATKDRTVHPDLERAAAKRMKATTVETDSSHVPPGDWNIELAKANGCPAASVEQELLIARFDQCNVLGSRRSIDSPTAPVPRRVTLKSLCARASAFAVRPRSRHDRAVNRSAITFTEAPFFPRRLPKRGRLVQNLWGDDRRGSAGGPRVAVPLSG